jgi:hypothetical protein
MREMFSEQSASTMIAVYAMQFDQRLSTETLVLLNVAGNPVLLPNDGCLRKLLEKVNRLVTAVFVLLMSVPTFPSLLILSGQESFQTEGGC